MPEIHLPTTSGNVHRQYTLPSANFLDSSRISKYIAGRFHNGFLQVAVSKSGLTIPPLTKFFSPERSRYSTKTSRDRSPRRSFRQHSPSGRRSARRHSTMAPEPASENSPYGTQSCEYKPTDARTRSVQQFIQYYVARLRCRSWSRQGRGRFSRRCLHCASGATVRPESS
jgi:hypothetical protein